MLYETIERLQELMKIQPIKQQSIGGEIEEIDRTVEYLNDEEGIKTTTPEIIKALQASPEIVLSDDIWEKLENTESNEIAVGDFDAVQQIADKYDKTEPKILIDGFKTGQYNRPLILKFNNRYYLIAGNTRLCTAAALGFKPKVLIASLDEL